MSITNIAILCSSVALQLLLLTLLFTQRMASQLRFFTILVGFYLVRSVAMAALFRWISPGSYVQIYTVLSAVDVLLQIALALEFSLLIVQVGERPYLPRALVAPAVFLIAAGLASGIAALLPAYPRAPVDRAGIFTGLLFLGLFAWSLSVRLVGWQRSALVGLAGIGAAGVVAQVGRELAAVHQNAGVYRLWSYSNAAVYLVTLVVWIVHCKPASSSNGEVRAAISHGDNSIERDGSSPHRTLSAS